MVIQSQTVLIKSYYEFNKLKFDKLGKHDSEGLQTCDVGRDISIKCCSIKSVTNRDMHCLMNPQVRSCYWVQSLMNMNIEYRIIKSVKEMCLNIYRRQRKDRQTYRACRQTCLTDRQAHSQTGIHTISQTHTQTDRLI